VIKREHTKEVYQCCISAIEAAYHRCISTAYQCCISTIGGVFQQGLLGLCQVRVILASSLRA
jgi:hypothetical protein